MKKVEVEDKIGYWMTTCERYFAEKDPVLKRRLYNHLYKAENALSIEELKTISSMNERGRIAAKRLLSLKKASSQRFFKNTSSGKITATKQLEDLITLGVDKKDGELSLSIPEIIQGYTVVEELYLQLRELMLQINQLLTNNLKR